MSRAPVLENYLVWNDVHFPFEDKQRYAVSLKVAKDIPNLAHIYLNGDIGEFIGVSAWPSHPEDRGLGFCAELAYLNKKFDELMDLFPGVPVTYVCGNHEYRFFRYVRDVAPAMWGLLDCPQLLQFERRPLWKFVDYDPSQLVRCGKSNLYLRHEPLGAGASHAKSTAEKAYMDILYGHTHVLQSYSHKKFGLKPFVNSAYSGGWLGDKSKKVFDYRGSKDNWVEGFSRVECDISSGQYSYEFIDLRTLPVLYRGKKYDCKAK